jgi:Tfp pilus assembly protein PilN
MMPHLPIDFSRSRAKPAPTGMILLIAASAMLLASGERLWRAYENNDRAQVEMDTARHQSLAQKNKVIAPVTPAVKLAEKQGETILRELTVPWQDLLAIVEDYRDHDVALIGIDQNPAQSQIRITAEAKDFDAMIAYLKYLQRSVLLREAVLNSHLVETNVAGTPVRFQVTAIWKAS